jgi:predicted tellurium resistance membrane protein TerC
MIESLLTFDGFISLATLVLLEIVLGIDNIIFIAILCGYLPRHEQQRARVLGLSLALIMRIILLMGISALTRMTKTLFSIAEWEVSGRDLILFAGGVFLIFKTFSEIIGKVKHNASHPEAKEKRLTMSQAIFQITLIDIVFSFDSILTAVGLSQHLEIMILAVTISMIVMIFFARYVSDFINRYPTIKMLALAFLLCIGFLLVVEALHIHIDRAYVYFAMAFSILVELLNIRVRKNSEGEAS